MKIKNAFSLSEALITLVMLGVIAALTIPNISSSVPDKDRTLFLKAFHTIEAINADIIKDATRYDQNIDATTSLGFNEAPLGTAQVDFTGVSLTQANAYCYFVAEQINGQGEVNCASSDVVNVKTINNICYRNLPFPSSSETHDIIVDIGCKNESRHKYAITVSAKGKTTVPETSTKSNNKIQKKAAYWIEHQDSTKTEI